MMFPWRAKTKLTTPDWRIILFLLVTAGLLTGVKAYQNPPLNPDDFCCDHLFYRSMAFNLFSVTRPEFNLPPSGNKLWDKYDDPYFSGFFHLANGLNRQPPYVYRVVVPLVSRLIARLFFHDDIRYGFYVLSFLSLTMASFFVSLTLYLLTGHVIEPILGSILFSMLQWTAAFNLSDYMLTDPLAFCLIALAVVFIVQQKRYAFFSVCFLGLFTKEIIAFLIPAYLLYELLESRLSGGSVVAAATIVTVYVLYRLSVPVPLNTYSLQTTFIGFPGRWRSILSWPLAVFGVLTFFAISRMWLSKIALSLTPLAIGSFASAFFATDESRALVYAFPFVILAVLGVRATSTGARVLGIVPIFVYFLLETIQVQLQLRFIFFALMQFVIFVIIESSFLFQSRHEVSRGLAYSKLRLIAGGN